MRQEQIDRLTELQDANGRLTPEAVVTDARDPQSPLHELFNWDVKKAAEGFWLDRARSIIRSVEVVIKTHRTVVRTPYYVRDPEAEQQEQGYVAITKVRSEPDLARDVFSGRVFKGCGHSSSCARSFKSARVRRPSVRNS